MAFKSSRPTYAIILLALSTLWLCAIFLPLLYSVLFPNDDIRGVVQALEERGTAPPEAAAAVQEAIAAVGPLKRAIQVAYYSGATASVQINGSHTSEIIKQINYIAWFQQPPKLMLISITRYERDGGERAYAIRGGDPTILVRGYALPLLLFGGSLFLTRRRKSISSEEF